MIFHMVCAKKTTRVVRKKFEYTCFQCLILSFLHRAHRMSFYSKNLHGCEELVYICTPFFSEFFKKFYYFLNFTKSEGVGELGLTYEFPTHPSCCLSTEPHSNTITKSTCSTPPRSLLHVTTRSSDLST